MARYKITIEDAPDGRVKFISDPHVGPLLAAIRSGKKDLTAVQVYTAECAMLAIKRGFLADKAEQRIILP